MSNSKMDTPSFTTLQTHLQLQSNRTTIGESGKRMLKDGSQSSFNDNSTCRSIPRMSIDSGVDEFSTHSFSSASTKPVDRKISLPQSMDSYSGNSSPRSFHTMSTLSTITNDSRQASFETESEE